MAGPCEENGSWGNAKNNGRKTVYRKKERKTSFKMDGQRRQRIGSSGDWLSRRPRLTQGCNAEWMDGWNYTTAIEIIVTCIAVTVIIINTMITTSLFLWLCSPARAMASSYHEVS
jgi:hypothetical protein